MKHMVVPVAPCGERCSHCEARSLSVCDALDDSQFVELERLSQPILYASKEILFAEQDALTYVFNITRGVVRLSKLLPDGRRQIVGFGLTGDFLGMTPSDRHSFSAEAIGPVTVCRFAKSAFTRFVGEKPNVLRRLNEFANRDLSEAQEQMLLLGRRSAEEKIAAFVLNWRSRLQRTNPVVKNVPLPMSRQDIADFLGLTIETVSRTFTKLEREKAIVIVPQGVRLLDSERVEALATA